MPRAAIALVVLIVAALVANAQEPAASDPTPQTLDEFKTAAEAVVRETGVPGAGLALVRAEGVEWEGGLGYADRDQRTPVTADTHFRVGSISKSFVALAMVQLYEHDLLDLFAPVHEIAPEIAIDNPWHSSEPVRVIHLLQHTAGFDDMHFNERYVPEGGGELSLEDVLALNPASRRVRWQPGTRMSYANPGYAVAGRIIEKVSKGEPYEDVIRQTIFEPLGMTTSSFRLTAEDEATLARGYDGPDGPPVGFPRIYLRPAGNMHSSARELALFVRMILNWGRLGRFDIVDPEYLGSMEQPRTTLAAKAGLRNGYGNGISSILSLPYPLLGHGGGIDGFLSQYAYSPSRDVGFVILLNSIGGRSQEAMNRLSSLAIRYLKRDVEPPEKPRAEVDAATLDQFTGYYHDAAPRNQIAFPVQSLFAGRTIVREGSDLHAVSLVGERTTLIPVSKATFRLEREIDASRVFYVDANGRMVLSGVNVYAERQPRWRIEIVRVPTLAAIVIVLSAIPMALVWAVRYRNTGSRFWKLKLAVLLCPILLIAPAAALVMTPQREWGRVNLATITVFVTSAAFPLTAALVGILALSVRRQRASYGLVAYALAVGYAMAGLSLYLASYRLLGIRLWSY